MSPLFRPRSADKYASYVRRLQLRSIANPSGDVAAFEPSARALVEVDATAASGAPLRNPRAFATRDHEQPGRQISVPYRPDPLQHRFGRVWDPEAPKLRIFLLRASGR